MKPGKLVVFAFVAIYLQGCVSVYSGGKPNFKATGKEAAAEIEKFSLVEHTGIFGCGPCLELGPEKIRYTVPSMQPLVESVSPETAPIFARVETWRRVQLVTLGVAVASLVAGLIAQNTSTRNIFFDTSIVGSVSSIVAGVYSEHVISEIPAPYNRDLRNKFTPTLGMNWGF